MHAAVNRLVLFFETLSPESVASLGEFYAAHVYFNLNPAVAPSLNPPASTA